MRRLTTRWPFRRATAYRFVGACTGLWTPMCCPMTSGTTQNLTGVWGVADTLVVAVGSGGTILRYNGSAWAPMTSGSSEPLTGVWGTAWDRIFAVLEDNDQAMLRQFGLMKSEQELASEQASIGNGKQEAALVETLSDEEIETLLSEREAVRSQGNFARADQIRDELQNGGVLVEDTKAGTRWKRK